MPTQPTPRTSFVDVTLHRHRSCRSHCQRGEPPWLQLRISSLGNGQGLNIAAKTRHKVIDSLHNGSVYKRPGGRSCDQTVSITDHCPILFPRDLLCALSRSSQFTMVALSRLALSLAAVAVSQAAPAAPAAEELGERGPMNFVMDFDHILSKRFGNFSVREIGPRSNTNYVQNYKTGGTVNFSPSTNSFTLNWNTQQDFVVGVGWNPGGHS
jgi:hypothetical protein